MERDEELARYIEERDQLERESDVLNEQIDVIESQVLFYEEDHDWNYLWREIKEVDNEIQALTNAIKNLMDCS